jgi:hypothetical protein
MPGISTDLTSNADHKLYNQLPPLTNLSVNQPDHEFYVHDPGFLFT